MLKEIFKLWGEYASKKHEVFLLCLAGLLLSSCSPLKLLNVVTPSSGYVLTENIHYDQHQANTLDVYQPKTACDQCPVLIWFHGGAWQTGDKSLYTFIGEAFTSQGLVVVIPNYRKYPNLYPDFMNDAAKAVSWAHANVSQWGGDPNNLHLMGHSSGAYQAIMLAFNRLFLEQQKVSFDAISSVIGLAGPYDFLPLTEPKVKEIFAPVSPLILSQPIYYVEGNAPSVMLGVGLKDKRVNPNNSLNMAQKIKAAGGKIKLITYPTLNHSDILIKLARPLRKSAQVYQDSVDFIQANQLR